MLVNADKMREFLAGLPVLPDSPLVINFLSDQTQGFGVGVEAGFYGDNNLACAFYPRSFPRRSGFDFRSFTGLLETREEKIMRTMFVVNIHRDDRVVWNVDSYRQVVVYLPPVGSSDVDGIHNLLPKGLGDVFNDLRAQMSDKQSRIELVERGINHLNNLSKILLEGGKLQDENLARVSEISKIIQDIKNNVGGVGNIGSSLKDAEKKEKK